MARAREMGFDTPVYHGTTATGTTQELMDYGLDSGTYVTASPEYASLYARGEGGSVLPLMTRSEDVIDIREGRGRELWKRFLSEREFPEGYEPRVGPSGLNSRPICVRRS